MKIEICELCFRSERPCTCKEIVTNDSKPKEKITENLEFAMNGLKNIIKEKRPAKVKLRLGNIHVTLQIVSKGLRDL